MTKATQRLMPVVMLIQDGGFRPFKRDEGPEALNREHMTGLTTAETLAELTGSDEITPWLGAVLQTPDGPDVYDLDQLKDDMERMAEIITDRGGDQIFVDDPRLIEAPVAAAVMLTALEAMDCNLQIDPDCLDEALERADHSAIARALSGYQSPAD